MIASHDKDDVPSESKKAHFSMEHNMKTKLLIFQI